MNIDGITAISNRKIENHIALSYRKNRFLYVGKNCNSDNTDQKIGSLVFHGMLNHSLLQADLKLVSTQFIVLLD